VTDHRPNTIISLVIARRLTSFWYISSTTRGLECVLPLRLPIVMVLLRSIFALAFVGLVYATPVTVKRQAITTLSPTQINEFAPFTHFASTGYCNQSTTKNWRCGAAFTHCFALRRSPQGILAEMMLLQPTARQTLTFNQWHLEVTAIVSSFVSKRFTADTISNNAHNSSPGYVGYSPSLKTVIVAHQGTDTHNLYLLFYARVFLTTSLTSNKSFRLPVITDAAFFLYPLNTTLFTGIPPDVEAHIGFSTQQARYATFCAF
jgi:hypothetical protein